MIRLVVVLLAIAAVAPADMVITTKEVFTGKVVDGDTSAVRIRLASGEVEAVPAKDIFEIRMTDPKNADWLRMAMPGTAIVVDTRADKPDSALVPPPGAVAATPRDAVRPGAWMLAGQAGFAAQSVEGMSYTTFTLSPAIAYFITRSIGLGLDLSLTSISMGGASVSTSAIGPKVVVALGPQGTTSYFLAEFGIGLTGQTGSSGGDRTWFGAGFLPTVGGHLGIPVELKLLIDRVSSVRMTTWQLGIGLCGLM